MNKEINQSHALLSASAAHRWLTCPPSARLEQQEENECSVYAEEGITAHELAEIKLSYHYGKIMIDEYYKRLEEFKQSERGKNYYNAEFEEYVDEFVDFIRSRTADYKNYHIYFELKVNFSNVVPQGFGTTDVLIVTEDTIEVIDLKFGKGVPVTAKENPQLRLYAMGALNLFPNSKNIITIIHQPRLSSIDIEELTKEELLKWAFEFVKPRADMAVEGKGTFHASEEACRFCKLRGKCKVRADNALALAQKEFEITEVEAPPLPQTLSPEQISRILDIAPLFNDWFKDVQAYALGQLVAGVKIPGYKLVEGRSNRKITDEAKVKEILLSTGLTEEMIMKPAELLGISKLEALVGKKLFANLCADYLIKPQGKLTLAPESDRRPGLDTLALAQRDFA